MKIINWLVKIFDKLINNIVLIILIILLFYSGYALYDAYATYEKAELTDDILQYKPEENEKFSLDSIQKEINEDICAWIRINDTNIDYPVVIGKDNSEYINNDYRKEYSITGSIFVDYRNNRYFKDDYTIIYGHNLKADLMFAEVRNYADKEYFDAHSKGLLYTGDKIYNIDIIYFETINAYSKVYSLALRRNDKNKELIEEFEKYAITKSDIKVTSKDKLILLSTCNSSDTETRSILVGKLNEVDASNIINEEKDITLNQIDKQLTDKEKYAKDSGEIKDNEEENNFIKYRVYIIIAIILIITVLIIFYIFRKIKVQEEKKKKIEPKHMK